MADSGDGFTKPVAAPRFRSLSPDMRMLISLLAKNYGGVATSHWVMKTLAWNEGILDSLSCCVLEVEQTDSPERNLPSREESWLGDKMGALVLRVRRDDFDLLILTERGHASWRDR